MNRRVVVTGLGVIAPNGHGLEEFEKSLREGKSGIRFIPKLEELNFACQVGGIPQGVEEKLKDYFTEDDLLAMNEAMHYAGIAGIDAWRDAGLEVPSKVGDTVHWDTGAYIGAGSASMETTKKVIEKVDAGKTRRLGSTMVEQIMMSSVSAKMSGLLALGNEVTTNSSACTTGTEAIILGVLRIRSGLADKMLCGGTDGSSPYIWAGFDAMKVLNSSSNDKPEKASRPMSASAGGFIPGSGCGLLMLESLESALKRNARIYAEVIGTALNCGGQRQGGSMTAPNPEGVRRCIQLALADAGITGNDVDVINGHLTATMADPLEIKNWSLALGRGPGKFPLIHSTKSLIGHGLGAAGGLEAVASVLEVYKGFVHGSLNCEDLHEEIKPFAESIVQKTVEKEIKILAKSSFGFGDVNGCVLYKKYEG